MPTSDTNESSGAPVKSRMGNLQPDIIFEIAKLIEADAGRKKLRAFYRLSLINKHWAAHMRLYPPPSNVTFDCSSSRLNVHHSNTSSGDIFQRIEKWLMHPLRRNRIVNSFSFTFDSGTDYKAFCQLLDKQLRNVESNSFALINDSKESFFGNISQTAMEFPRSLKARQLSICNFTSTTFNWKTLNQSLRDNLVSLHIEGTNFNPLDDYFVFHSLRKLYVDLSGETDIHQWNEFLQRHPSINDLTIHGGEPEEESLPPLIIDSLENLYTLEVMACMPVDLESKKIQHVSLKTLCLYEVDRPMKNWTGLSNSLTTVIINAGTEILSSDHDLLNPRMLYKLDNIKYFEYGEIETSRLTEGFNQGLYDDAMPLIEDIRLFTHISREALHCFFLKHKHLRRVWVESNEFQSVWKGDPLELCCRSTDERFYLTRDD